MVVSRSLSVTYMTGSRWSLVGSGDSPKLIHLCLYVFIEPLLCSHAECQNRGIRFLYCSACDGPVAQGNFSTRHAHPEVRKFKARGEENDGHSSSATNGSVIDSTTTDSSSNDDAVSTTSSNSTSEGDSGTSSS